MEFYEVLEKRRTYRDYSDCEVSDEILKRVIGAAFKAPTNDHLRQLEFIVVRGRENIAKVIEPLAKNMEAFKNLVHEVDESGDKDKMDMFADALPKQQRMLMQSGLLILPSSARNKVRCSNPKSKARSTTLLRHGAHWKICCSPPLPKAWEPCSTFPLPTKWKKSRRLSVLRKTTNSPVCLRWVIPQKMPFCPNKKKSTLRSGYIRIFGNTAT